MKEPFIPWNTGKLWSEVNDSIRHLCKLHQNKLQLTNKYTRQLHENLTSVFSEMDLLCGTTCVSCKETCCSVAKLWYDFKDLIFLHITGIQIPNAQPLNEYKEVCRYLSPTGCILDRMRRPWICTHYLCHTQTAYLRKHDRTLLKNIDVCLIKIKRLRNDMEEEFIKVTT